MGTIADKLDYLNTTKTNIKNAIIEKGVEVSDSDTFRSYATRISDIPILDSVEELTVTENGTYTGTEGVTYNPVNVNLPLGTKTLTANGTYTASDDSLQGYSEVTVDIDDTDLYRDTTDSTYESVKTLSNCGVFPMLSLKAEINAVQDLHGYDSPWVGGSGKNKIDYASTIKDGFSQGLTFKQDVQDYISVTGTTSGSMWGCTETFANLSNGNYKIVCSTTDTKLNFIIINGNTLVGYLEKNGATSFEMTSSKTDYKVGLRIDPNVSINGKISVMVVADSVTDLTFAPYSNECPISGWSAVDVTRTGKNLFDKTATDTNKGFISGKWINQTGNTFSYSEWNVSEYIRVDGEKIAVSGMTEAEQVSSGRGGYCCYDENKNVLGGGIYNALTQTITLPTNTKYIRISVWNQNKDVCQLELGNQVTTYEPYNGSTITIQLGDTYYWCKLDVVSGLLTVLGVLVDMGTLTWAKQGDGFFYSNNVEGLKIAGDAISSLFKIEHYYPTMLRTNCTLWISDVRNQIMAHLDGYTVTADFKTAMNGVQLVYELATPTTIQLTPTQVNSLLGTTNLWADTGDVGDVRYFKKVEL